MAAWMIALLVLGGVGLLLAALLFCPVIVDMRFVGHFVVKLRVLGIPITVFSQKKKPKPKKEKSKSPEKIGKFSKIRGILKRSGLSGLLGFFKELARIAGSTGKKLFSHLRVYRFSLLLAVANEDAAKTAVTYGQVCAAVYPAVSVLTTVCHCKQSHVCVTADFDDIKTKVDFRLKAGLLPVFLLIAGVGALVRLVNTYRNYVGREPEINHKKERMDYGKSPN